MELGNIFPSKYVKASDLKGKEPTVTIDRAEIETLGNDRKLVIYFRGTEKGLVVNRTNADRIAYAYGTNTDDWLGQQITLYVDLVPFNGRTVEATRVKVPQKRASVAGGNITSGTQHTAERRPVQQDRPDLDDQIPF